MKITFSEIETKEGYTAKLTTQVGLWELECRCMLDYTCEHVKRNIHSAKERAISDIITDLYKRIKQAEEVNPTLLPI